MPCPQSEERKAGLAAKDRKEACDLRADDCCVPMSALRAAFAIEPFAFPRGYKILIVHRESQRPTRIQLPIAKKKYTMVGAVAPNGLCAARAVGGNRPYLFKHAQNIF
jgi:hypothetical protein